MTTGWVVRFFWFHLGYCVPFGFTFLFSPFFLLLDYLGDYLGGPSIADFPAMQARTFVFSGSLLIKVSCFSVEVMSASLFGDLLMPLFFARLNPFSLQSAFDFALEGPWGAIHVAAYF